ncbi:MAG: Hsp20/alpha crystallin family protein [Planctomycetes bacterium]|nr:Hsp20/alpha crystallin family protein [Planctomycetota bacterium]
MDTMEKTQEQQIHVTSGNDAEKSGSQQPASQSAGQSQEQRGRRREYVPAVDLIESEKEVTLIVDIPGVPESGVDLNIEKSILSLTAVPEDGVIAGKKLAYSEYGVGEYKRSFALSDDIDKENVSAKLKNGVLRITLPKSAPVTKKIGITAE